MTSASYRFGLLTVVFGGFVSLNRAQFGMLGDFVGSLGMAVMFVGVVVGILGLLPSDASHSVGSGSNGPESDTSR